MMIKGITVCLTALALLGLLCDAKSIHQKPNEPERPSQVKQTIYIPFTWTYPEPEEKPTSTQVLVPVNEPEPADTVTATCGETTAVVTVQKDMFGNGQIINPNDLLLGSCSNVFEDSTSLGFEPQLHECESISEMQGDFIIYTFTLRYNPQPLSGSNVVRTNKATVIVECHYPRHHNVTSLPLEPKWVPFSTVKVSEQSLLFSLKLKTDDWVFERAGSQYFLGDLIYIEASVIEFHHVSLRVFVDSCTASVLDSPNGPTYTLIDNNGCFLDSLVTRSKSKFWPRTHGYKLQFQFEAFMFSEITENVNLQITCNLRATSAAHEIDEVNRACSFYDNRWNEVDGNNNACNSCPAPSSSGGGVGGNNYNPSTGGGYQQSGGGNFHHPSAGGGYQQSGGGSSSGNGGGSARYSGGHTYNPSITGAKKKQRQQRQSGDAPATYDEEWRARVTLGNIHVSRRESN